SGRKVLIVGAGTSGCDIAVDAVHRADKVGLSVRRGYYFVPNICLEGQRTLWGEVFKSCSLNLYVKESIKKFFHGSLVMRSDSVFLNQTMNYSSPILL